jgi:hypothetical protein
MDAITIATVVIAISTVVNVCLVVSIKSKNNQYQNESKDMLHAMVLSTLATTRTGGSPDDAYNWYIAKYAKYKSGKELTDVLNRNS